MSFKITFSKHALYQMNERNISEAEVILALSEPDKITPELQGKFRAIKLIKRNGKKYLMIVIHRKINSIKKVITVFLTSKIDKYLPK